jgi:hypothetical protein
MKPNDLENYRFEKIIEKDLGQMVLIYDEVLCARSSSKIYFFKQEKNIYSGIWSWQLYHTISVRGFIYYIKGNVRI